MTRRRDARSIEDDLDRDRAKLGSAFDSLFNRSTVDLFAREAMHLLRTNGSYRETAEAVVRRNPLAVAVTGLGLAWLAFGAVRRTPEDDVEDVRHAARRTGRRVRAAVHDEAELIEDTDWAEALDALRAKASARLRKLEDDARAYRDDVTEGVANRAGDARDYMSERAALLADLAEDMKERFADGLDHLTHAAQDRIVQAREEAYAARLRAEEALGKGGREAKRLVEDHPMVSAAVALALGTAFGAAVLHRRRSVAEEEVDEVSETLSERLEEARESWRNRKSARR